jgi:LEA14-like dessication related protein
MNILIRCFALLMLALPLVACQNLGLENPDVTLHNIEPTNVTAFETTARVSFRVTNPNRIPLKMVSSSHDLALGGVKVGQALSPDGIDIPSMDSGIVVTEINISNLTLVRQLLPIFETRSFDYAVTSKLQLSDALLGRTLSMTNSGNFTLPEASARKFNALNLTNTGRLIDGVLKQTGN